MNSSKFVNKFVELFSEVANEIISETEVDLKSENPDIKNIIIPFEPNDMKIVTDLITNKTMLDDIFGMIINDEDLSIEKFIIEYKDPDNDVGKLVKFDVYGMDNMFGMIIHEINDEYDIFTPHTTPSSIISVPKANVCMLNYTDSLRDMHM